MSFPITTSLLAASIFLFVSCTEPNREAQSYLDDIRALYQNGEYETVMQKIDSIQILYPKSYGQIKAGRELLQDARRAYNRRQIAVCDSLIAFLSPKIDSLKNYFTFDINRKYQETGWYIPKGSPASLTEASTTLRSKLNDKGKLFLESVFTGSSSFHNQVCVSTNDGYFVETLPVNDEGLNFRFLDAGKQYEIVQFSGKDENSVSKFIYVCSEKALTVSLKGKNPVSFPLTAAAKKAIADSYLLSMWIQQADSLKSLKEKSGILLKYLDKK